MRRTCQLVLILLTLAMSLSLAASAQSPAADGQHAVYTSKVTSFCNTSAEAFAAGDFTFIRKASGQLLEGTPKAKYVLVLDVDGKKVYEAGEKAEPGNLTGAVQETPAGLWVKEPVTFAGKTVNTVVVLFPSPPSPVAAAPAAPPPPASTPVASQPAPPPPPSSGVPLWVVIGGLVVIAIVVVGIVASKPAPQPVAAAAPPPADPEEKRRELRRKLGLDQVKDAFLGKPITKDAVFVVVKAKVDGARPALLPEETSLVDRLSAGQSLSAVTSSVSPHEEMALHTALYRLMSAGLIEQKG